MAHFFTYSEAVAEIIEAGKFLAQKGWAPASAGNYSARLQNGNLAITASGYDKGELTPAGIMEIDLYGQPVLGDGAENSASCPAAECGGKSFAKKPSAETFLHCQIYQAYADCGAVLHTHSVASTVFSRLRPRLASLVFTDYEFLKLFPAVQSHAECVELPFFENSQDMPALARKVSEVLKENHRAYLIKSHGIYAWGQNLKEARRIAEAVEFMIACEWELLRACFDDKMGGGGVGGK